GQLGRSLFFGPARDGHYSTTCRLPLGNRRPLPSSASSLSQLTNGDDRCGPVGFYHAGISISQCSVATVDFLDSTVITGEWPLCPLANRHTAECFQLHGCHPSRRLGHEKRNLAG